MEKRNISSRRQQEQSDVLMMKIRLEEIMTTFQEERLKYEQEHRIKINKLERQISQKNIMIGVLNKKLDQSRVQALLNKNQVQKYKRIVKELKYQFFKMGNAVNQIDTQFSVEERKDNIAKIIDINFSNQTKSMFFTKDPLSPSKSNRFDINAYFKAIRQDNTLSHDNFFLKDDKSAQTKNTESNSQEDGICQKFSEITCFKDLINNNYGQYSLLHDAKSSQKIIQEPNSNFPKSNLEMVKQNRWKVCK